MSVIVKGRGDLNEYTLSRSFFLTFLLRAGVYALTNGDIFATGTDGPLTLNGRKRFLHVGSRGENQGKPLLSMPR